MSAITLHRRKNSVAENRSAGSEAVPALRNGDHLTVPEFERRYWAMPELNMPELVEGIVVMPSPISDIHSDAHGVVAELLRRYARHTKGIGCNVAGSVRLDGKNEYQPDVFLRVRSGPLARSRRGADGLIEGAPEFVAEVAVSSVGYDLHEKRTAYERGQVQEYFVWQVMDARILWFALEQGEFVELKPRTDGIVCSRVFPGLWLNVQAMLDGDDEKVSQALDKGIKSAEHRAFLKRLAEKGKS